MVSDAESELLIYTNGKLEYVMLPLLVVIALAHCPSRCWESAFFVRLEDNE